MRRCSVRHLTKLYMHFAISHDHAHQLVTDNNLPMFSPNIYNWQVLPRAHPCLFRLFNTEIGALRAPAPPSASLILQSKLMIYRENPAKNLSLEKNPRKCIPPLVQFNNATAVVTVNLNVSQIRLNNEQSILTLPFQSSPSNPSLSKPSVSSS